jgi:hypothetical protein
MRLILARIWPIAFMAIVHGPWCKGLGVGMLNAVATEQGGEDERSEGMAGMHDQSSLTIEFFEPKVRVLSRITPSLQRLD